MDEDHTGTTAAGSTKSKSFFKNNKFKKKDSKKDEKTAHTEERGYSENKDNLLVNDKYVNTIKDIVEDRHSQEESKEKEFKPPRVNLTTRGVSSTL
jgi:hypothetical protein